MLDDAPYVPGQGPTGPTGPSVTGPTGSTGPTGPTGPSCSDSAVRVYGEESNELPNGSRVQFTWDAAWVADTECIYVDGVRQIRGASRSYLATPASAKIDFNSSDDAPHAGSVVTADYDVA